MSRVSVNGDPLLLQQAFLNVLINAEHAITDTGGPGTIEVTTEKSADGAAVVTRIRDTGPGIPSDVLPRIFDPFFTTKEVNRGTGLGLTIAYGIVQEHGGSIHAENVAGRRRDVHDRAACGGEAETAGPQASSGRQELLIPKTNTTVRVSVPDRSGVDARHEACRRDL